MNRKIGHLFCCILFAGLFFSCREVQHQEYIDLRFLAGDSYELPASSPEPVRIQVKSTAPWTVYGKNSHWCTITPSEGPSGELFDVEIRYNDNPNMDDRLDTLVIQSGYWIGKWIPVRQKGIAYLELYDTEGIVLSQFGASGTFGIRSNQKWSVVPDISASWLTVSTLSGNGDGTVSFGVSQPNKGEKRTASLKVLDRHGELVQTVQISQAGVELVPEQTVVKTDFTAKKISINVSSNADWTAVKENPDCQWLSFENATFEGDGTLTVSLTENNGNSIRTAFVLLQTPEVEDAERVVKTIIIRQAYDPAPEYYEFDEYELGEWIINKPDNNRSSLATVGDDLKIQGAQKIHRYHLPSGNYDFYFKEASSGSMPVIYFQTGEIDFRWHTKPKEKTTDLKVIDKGKEKLSGKFNVGFDNSQPHVLGVGMSADADGYLVLSWLLDGKILGSYAANGADVQTSEILFSKDVEFHVFIGAYESGTANHYTVWDAWQYTLPYDFIEWGE